MKIIHTIAEMRAFANAQHLAGRTTGFVPTMGYLHEGHLSLMRIARQQADALVVSLFVNPMQFNVAEDLDKYPRDEQGDFDKCAAEGCEAMFFPSAEEIYPAGYQTRVELPELCKRLEGEYRPGHLTGVATVVSKLFNIVTPDVAVFGQKDFQQLALVTRMAADLNLPVKIIGGPTVREADGLAMSSRNARLSPESREKAVCLSKALFAARVAYERGERDAATLIAHAKYTIETESDGRIDYIDIADADTLEPLIEVRPPSVMSLAAWFDPVRLIDNIRLDD